MENLYGVTLISLERVKEVIRVKSFIIVGLILLTIFLATGSTFACHHHHHCYRHFRAIIAPTSFWIGPPAVYDRGYYPPRTYYEPYYGPGRVRVPGYWEKRWTPYGWKRVRIPGYWR